MTRITIHEAKKRFANGEMIVLCPSKFYPQGAFSMGCRISSAEWLERTPNPKEAWEQMYNNWKFYNATYETGYYAHYYLD